MDLQEAHGSVNKCWQLADDMWDWFAKERRGCAEYQAVIDQLDEALNHLDEAANLLEKLKG